jgi:hypothetical protein
MTGLQQICLSYDCLALIATPAPYSQPHFRLQVARMGECYQSAGFWENMDSGQGARLRRPSQAWAITVTCR